MNSARHDTARGTVDDAIDRRVLKRCSGCGAPMWWGRTVEGGKAIPLDGEPDPAGNLVVAAVGPDPNRDGETAFWIGQYRADEDPGGIERRWVSHFVTCPQRDRFRKKGGR